MPVKTAKINLFENAIEVDSETDNKSKVLTLPIPKDLKESHDTYVKTKKEINDLESKFTIAETTLKGKAPEIYLNQYKVQGRHFGSFKLGEILVSVQDKYKKLSKIEGKLLIKTYPDVIIKKTEYGFNQEILEKYIKPISDALLNVKNMPMEDLSKLIEKEEVYYVKKGAIHTLSAHGDQMNKLFEAISPVISMR